MLPCELFPPPFNQGLVQAIEGMGQTFTSTSFYLLLIFFLFIPYPTATGANMEIAPSGNEGVCSLVNCEEGTCVPSNSSFPGFECQCFPGWKKSFPFPACVLPNCTVNFGCGNGAPPPLQPPPSFPPPPFNLSDPCGLVWCGDGNCIANGTSGHICQCNNGSENILNNTSLPCLKQCSLGPDCLGPSSPAPQPSPSGSPGSVMPLAQSPTPPDAPGLAGNGSLKGLSSSLRIPTSSTVIFLAAAFFASV